MPAFLRLIVLILIVMMAGCGSHDPVWRMKAQLTLLQLQGENAEAFRSDEFISINRTFKQGELLLTEDEDDELADEQFKLAYQKGVILKQELLLHKAWLKDEARKKEIEALVIREEEERMRLETERKRQEELQETQKNLQKKNRNGEDGDSDAGNHLLQPSSYTVRRGETLPQVAARPELYNDVALWPLIYRANRDQIRDPYQLWPGQILKIPRNFSKEEALEARKQAQRRGP